MDIVAGTQVIITRGFAANMTTAVEAIIPAREVEPGYFTQKSARVVLPGYGYRILPVSYMEAI